MTEHAGTEAQITPDAILAVGSGFMAAKHLFVASEIGLFSALADGPLSLDEVAERTGVPSASVRILADAMVTAPSNISDDLYARLRDRFSEEQLMELSAQIAFENFRARLNRAPDGDHCTTAHSRLTNT